MTNKIDPIGFACLISKVAAMRGEELYNSTVRDFHDLVIDAVQQPLPQLSHPFTVTTNQLDAMLLAIQQGKKIEAIKCYRVMSPCDLATAKDAIEKYWPVGYSPAIV